MPDIQSCLAQSKTDSLKNPIEAFHARDHKGMKGQPYIDIRDTTVIIALIALAGELKNENPDSALFLSKQALQLSEKIFFLFSKNTDIFIKKAAMKGMSNSLANLGYFNLNIGNLFLALTYFKKALVFSRALKDEKSMATILGRMGIVFSDQGHNKKAMTCYFRALDLATKSGDESGMGRHLGNIGALYFFMGDFQRALEYFFKALEITTKSGNRSESCTHLGNIGSMYNEMGNFPKALEYYFMALEIEKATGEEASSESELGNIGTVYQKQSENPNINPLMKDSLLEKAMENYFKALDIALSTRRKAGIGIWLGNIGNAYEAMENYSMALEYYLKALEKAQELGNKPREVIWIANIGSLYIKLSRYTDAENFLNKSLAIAEEIGSLDDIRVIHASLSDLYKELAGLSPKPNDYYLKAFKHIETSLLINDSITNEEKSENIGMMEARHEFAIADIERERIEKERAMAIAKTIKKRDRIQFFGIFIVLFVVILAAMMLLFAKFSIPLKIKNLSLFIALLFLFEFVLLIADTRVEKISGGDPVFKLAINAILALVFYFIQSFAIKTLFSKSRKLIPEFSETSDGINTMALLFCTISLVNLSAFNHKGAERNTEKAPLLSVLTNAQSVQKEAERNQNFRNDTRKDSLKHLLNYYQHYITLFCDNNKYQKAYQTMMKLSVVKDSLRQHEKRQEFARINEKQKMQLQSEKNKIIEKERIKKETERKKRTMLLKYSFIFIIILLLFIGLTVISFGQKKEQHSFIPSVLSRFPQRYLKIGLFVSFLLFFEFIIVLTEPLVDNYTGGAPAGKLVANTIIALCISPLHVFLEEKIGKKLERK